MWRPERGQKVQCRPFLRPCLSVSYDSGASLCVHWRYSCTVQVHKLYKLHTQVSLCILSLSSVSSCPCSLNTGGSVTTWPAADPVTVTLVGPSTTGTELTYAHYYSILLYILWSCGKQSTHPLRFQCLGSLQWRLPLPMASHTLLAWRFSVFK